MTHKQLGLTLVELMVITAVVVILAGVSILGFGNWRERSAVSEVKSDLINGASALQARINFEPNYPASQAEFDEIYDNTDSVDLRYTFRADDNSYCLDAQSLERPSVQWMLDSRISTTQPSEGSCS